MRIALAILLLLTNIFAKVQLPSNIAPASEHYIDLEHETCDESCLFEHVVNDEMGSFMARFDANSVKDVKLRQIYTKTKNNISDIKNIAILLPNSLKSYSKAIAKAMQTYVISQNSAISLRFIGYEDESHIKNAINQARGFGASIFIMPLQQQWLNLALSELKSDEIAYFPTINKQNFKSEASVLFGGIDYDLQLDYLSKFVDGRVIVFGDDSDLARRLNQMLALKNLKISNTINLSGSQLNPDMFEDKQDILNDSYIFLNLPLIKATFVGNYLPKFEIKPKLLLATQSSFTPQIFSLMARSARQDVLIASSLSFVSQDLEDVSSIFAQQWYNWVAYSSVLGFEILASKYLDATTRRDFSEKLVNAEIVYDTKVYEVKGLGFKVKN